MQDIDDDAVLEMILGKKDKDKKNKKKDSKSSKGKKKSKKDKSKKKNNKNKKNKNKNKNKTVEPSCVDLSVFFDKSSSSKAVEKLGRQIAKSFRKTGCLVVKDPRVSEKHNNTFLDLMERYYGQSMEAKMKDVHPELSFQVGATPEHTENPRDHCMVIRGLNGPNAAHKPTGKDPKWRYFWPLNTNQEKSEFNELNAPRVSPEAFPEFEETMDRWGGLMIGAVFTVATLLAIGLELPETTFTSLLKGGPHLLAPTGTDLNKYHENGLPMAGFHQDLNLMTIHGKSRFPGLFIWLRNGRKVSVKVPEGHLLLQAGQQLEHLTGGYIDAGFHEVVISDATLAKREQVMKQGGSLWRVSSTTFSHVNSDQVMVPQGRYGTPAALSRYPPIKAGEHVRRELEKINLKGTADLAK